MVEKAFRHLAERAIDDDLRGEQCKLLTAIDFGIPNENGTGGDGTMLQTMNTLRVSSLNQRKEKMKNNKKKEDSLEFLFQKMLNKIVPSIIDQHVRNMGGLNGMTGNNQGNGSSGGGGGGNTNMPFSSTGDDVNNDLPGLINEKEKEKEAMETKIEIIEKEKEEEEEDECIETKTKTKVNVQIQVKELQKVALKDLGMGICPASFDWLLGTESYWEENGMGTAESVNKELKCQVCNRNWNVIDGYRCTGGTHFFCGQCVKDKTKMYKKEAMKKAKAEHARTNYSTF